METLCLISYVTINMFELIMPKRKLSRLSINCAKSCILHVIYLLFSICESSQWALFGFGTTYFTSKSFALCLCSEIISDLKILFNFLGVLKQNLKVTVVISGQYVSDVWGKKAL